jgi:hypothetical protein
MDRCNESYDWIARIIETSNNDFHFEAIDRLIELHYQNFKSDEMKIGLEALKNLKWNEIHYVLN